ncbi:hypothetical protein LDENG_00185580 [Lucifuga dentata]|nr:hypothetical protein LDENG_00185580 [Lucifuga dentata]
MKINLFGSDGAQFVWRRSHEAKLKVHAPNCEAWGWKPRGLGLYECCWCWRTHCH